MKKLTDSELAQILWDYHYLKLGYQIPQDIPKNVWQANLELLSRGYTRHLMQRQS